jgi:hypothetical protein
VISIAFAVLIEDNLFDFLGLSRQMNTCYDDIYSTIALIKVIIQRDIDPSCSFGGVTERPLT